jgi:outer membrane autotransporter protein
MKSTANLFRLAYVFIAALAILAIGPSTSHAAEPTEPEGLKLSECPTAVQKTLIAEAKGTKIEIVETDTDDRGNLEYIANVVIKKHHYSITVATSGKLIQKALDNDKEEQLDFADCPPAVQQTLADEADGAEIETVEKDTQNGAVSYVAKVVIDGDAYSITVAENGVLIDKSQDGDDSDTDTPTTHWVRLHQQTGSTTLATLALLSPLL